MNIPRLVLTALESPRKPAPMKLPKVIPLALGCGGSELLVYKVDPIRIVASDDALPLAAVKTMGRQFASLLYRDTCGAWLDGLYQELTRRLGSQK